MMKNHGLLIALAAIPLWAASCQGLPEREEADRYSLLVRVSLPVVSKVTDASPEAESRLTDIRVFVFDDAGWLETSGTASSRSLSLRCRTGDKTVWVLANAPEAGSILRISDLESCLSRLSDNAPDRLVMAGSRALTVLSDMEGTVTVQRLCAKVTVGSITKAFTSAVLQERELRIRRVYMTNVAADCCYGTSTAPSSWYNRMGYQGDCPALLCDEVDKVASPTLSEPHIIAKTKRACCQIEMCRMVP